MAEYISRDKALKVIDALDDISDAWGCAIPMHTIKEKIKEIPAADVRPVVRARWNTVKYPLYECSNCGAVYQDVGYGFNFCPNCGADMRGGQDG